MICAVCFGDPGTPAIMAVNNGIWLLMAVIGTVLASFGFMFLNMYKRCKSRSS